VENHYKIVGGLEDGWFCHLKPLKIKHLGKAAAS